MTEGDWKRLRNAKNTGRAVRVFLKKCEDGDKGSVVMVKTIDRRSNKFEIYKGTDAIPEPYYAGEIKKTEAVTIADLVAENYKFQQRLNDIALRAGAKD